jgi:DNA-binding transcriptional ArsR family regulator
MRVRRSATRLLYAVLAAMLVTPLGAEAVSTSAFAFPNARAAPPPLAQDAPRILIDQPVRAVEYQLGRLTNDELTLVERKDDDVRYRPVYVALLTRKGIASQFRDEALAALEKMDKSSRSRVLLDALAKVPPDDQVTAEKLLGLLGAQPAEALRKERATFTGAIDAAATPPLVLRGAYAAVILGDGKPDQAWQTAQKHEGHLAELMLGARYI